MDFFGHNNRNVLIGAIRLQEVLRGTTLTSADDDLVWNWSNTKAFIVKTITSFSSMEVSFLNLQNIIGGCTYQRKLRYLTG